MKQFIAKIQSMFKGVLKDSVSAIKDILSNVPPEALFRIKGLQVPEYKVTPFPKSTDSISVDTTDMTMLEIACCTRKMKIQTFMMNNLHLMHSRDFMEKRRNKSI